MAWTYDQLITALWDRLAGANNDRASVSVARNAALIDWNAGDDHAAIGHIIDGMSETIQYMANMLAKGYYGWDGSTFLLPTALDRNYACPFITEAPEYDLTMMEILSTMYTAHPDEVQFFVALVDAYRQSIWNRPFPKVYYADLARGFMP